MELRPHIAQPELATVSVRGKMEADLLARFAYSPLRHMVNMLGIREAYRPNAKRQELGSAAPVRPSETDIKHKKLFSISARLGKYALKNQDSVAGNMFVHINHYLEMGICDQVSETIGPQLEQLV